jgi:hypothetical protein
MWLRTRLGVGEHSRERRHRSGESYESRELTDTLAVSTAVTPGGSAAEQRPAPRRRALPLRAAREGELLGVWPKAVNCVRAEMHSDSRVDARLVHARGPAEPHACTVGLQGHAICKMVLDEGASCCVAAIAA